MLDRKIVPALLQKARKIYSEVKPLQAGPSLKSSTKVLEWLEDANASPRKLADEDWFKFYELAEKLLNDYLKVVKLLHTIDIFTN